MVRLALVGDTDTTQRCQERKLGVGGGDTGDLVWAKKGLPKDVTVHVRPARIGAIPGENAGSS